MYLQSGKAMDYVAETALAANQPVVIGELVGVTKLPIAAGELGVIHFRGAFKLPKPTGEGSAIYKGDTLFWNAGGGFVTTTESTHKQIGRALEDAGTSDSTVLVCLWPAKVPYVPIPSSSSETTSTSSSSSSGE